MQWIRDKATEGYNYVRDSFFNRRPTVNRNNAMNTIDVLCCYNEDDEGFFATPSYMEQMIDNPIDLIVGQGFRKRRNKNYKTVRVHPKANLDIVAVPTENIFDGYNSVRDNEPVQANHVQNQIDYLQDMYIRFYRTDLFKTVKERMINTPIQKDEHGKISFS